MLKIRGEPSDCDPMTRFMKKLSNNASPHLAADELLLGGTRAFPDGMRETVWWFLVGFLLGLLIGILIAVAAQSSAVKKWMKQARASGFPGTQNMALVLTNRRILVFKRRGNKLKKLVGQIGLERIHSITLSARRRRPEITFRFLDAMPVTVETFKADRPADFVDGLGALVPGGVGGEWLVPPPVPAL
jgi:hypothetical protein